MFVDRFQCINNGECIDMKLTCDGENDCDDGSDEAFLNDGPCNAKNNCTNLKGKILLESYK